MNFAGVKSITIPEGDVKNIAIGGMTVWQKPNPLPYDAEVEYIESTGAQYIDTGVAPGDNLLSFDLVCENLAPSTTLRGAFGCRASSSAYTPGSYVVFLRASPSPAGGSESRVDIANSGSAIYASAPVGAETRFAWDAATRTLAVTIGGSSTPFAAASKEACNHNFLLCNASTEGAPAAVGTSMRIVSAKLWRSGSLVRDYQPVRVGSGAEAVGELYDRVSGAFAMRVGTFAIGPDKTTGEG